MAAVAPPQRPSSRDAGLHLIRELNLNGERQFGFPTPPTGHDLMGMWPALPPQVPDRPGWTYFSSQERAFFSRDNSFFRVQIDIDAPHTTQTSGGPLKQEKGKARAEPPQLSVIPRQHQHQPQQPQPQQPSPSSSWTVSPPSRHPSPTERRRTHAPSQPQKSRRSQPIPINPLPVSAVPTNNHHHLGQYQAAGHHSQYPYPPPELRHKSPTIIDDEAWRRPTPYSERRRAGKAPRRKCD